MKRGDTLRRLSRELIFWGAAIAVGVFAFLSH